MKNYVDDTLIHTLKITKLCVQIWYRVGRYSNFLCRQFLETQIYTTTSCRLRCTQISRSFTNCKVAFLIVRLLVATLHVSLLITCLKHSFSCSLVLLCLKMSTVQSLLSVSAGCSHSFWYWHTWLFSESFVLLICCCI